MALETISESTRKVRKSLLAASLVGLSISMIDVSISKITIFGTEFKIGNFQAIPFVLGVIVLYFLITFIFYVLSEYAHLHREGEKEFLLGLRSPVPTTHKEAKREVERLQTELERIGSTAGSMADFEKEFTEKQIKLDNMKSVLNYLKNKDLKLFDRFSFMNIRFVIELIVPITVGIFACIMVFFFTEFKVETAAKPEITIKTEKVVIQTQRSNAKTKPITEKKDQK